MATWQHRHQKLGGGIVIMRQRLCGLGGGHAAAENCEKRIVWWLKYPSLCMYMWRNMAAVRVCAVECGGVALAGA